MAKNVRHVLGFIRVNLRFKEEREEIGGDHNQDHHQKDS